MTNSIAQQGHVLSAQLLYPEALAFGLLLFAERNPSFKETLSFHIPPPKNRPSTRDSLPKAITLLYPKDEITALERATWIMKNGTTESRSILAEALKDRPYESPKAVVLGITIGVMPIGIMGHDKPGKKVTVISLDTLQDNESIIKGATKVSLNLLERSIQEAQGELNKIDPDMNDWFFGEKTLDFYKASKSTINEIMVDLNELDVPYTMVHDENGAIMLAVSPAINPETLSLDYDIEEIK
jgi:hypothetical protein